MAAQGKGKAAGTKKTAAKKTAAKKKPAAKKAGALTLTRNGGKKQPKYAFQNDPELIGIQVNRLTNDYYRLLMQNGALVGKLGQMQLAPYLEPIFDALHHLLAGGEVKIEITRAGSAELVQALTTAKNRAMDESNQVNERANYYLTMTP